MNAERSEEDKTTTKGYLEFKCTFLALQRCRWFAGRRMMMVDKIIMRKRTKRGKKKRVEFERRRISGKFVKG